MKGFLFIHFLEDKRRLGTDRMLVPDTSAAVQVNVYIVEVRDKDGQVDIGRILVKRLFERGQEVIICSDGKRFHQRVAGQGEGVREHPE